MPSKTNEQALEAAIEKALTGTCLEELASLNQQTNTTEGTFTNSMQAAYRTDNGYYVGYAKDFNAKYALDEVRFWHFLETTQSEELEKLQRASDWKLKILERFDRMVKKYGILVLLRKGLDVEDAHFELLYQLSQSQRNNTVNDRFEKNEFSVTRQVRYNVDNPREEIDMVVCVNGIPIASLELKNPWTGQNAKVHGVKQYMKERDHRQPLLQFGRCIVHFAVDTEEVYMCTKLDGNPHSFLPFNKGFNHGKGNPVNVFGHKTAYLWEDVFKRQNLAKIIQHFIRFDGKPTDALSKRTLYFPRYHQLDVVTRLVNHAAENGVGHSYLIQHSAGSGKSNSITWAAYQLIDVYPKHEAVPGARGLDTQLFDSVVVVTDRRLLDKQIRDNIREFSQVKSIVAPAYSSKDLKEALETNKRIIITTIQKFPVIAEGIADLSDKRFAVIIDEAHSSQSGTAAGSMNQAMGNVEIDEDSIDAQDIVLQALKSRKTKGNASYLAFTATPKNATLERFGTKKEDGSFEPFDLYSMKQAIEEGFILDVLAKYTTHQSYYEIEKSIEENPLFDTKRAQKRLRIHVERDIRTIEVKAEVMLEHFMDKVYIAKKLKGKGKGMVVTQDIPSAIRYYQSLTKLLAEKGNPFKIAIAFSGKKIVDGIEYTEAGLNGFAEKDTRDKFDSDEYRLLVVANKYLTGFDQPKLCTMYVDKKLQGVLAVQALSRLNRASHKLDKRTEDLFVLDFFNKVEDIQEAFNPFYTSTSLSNATDVNVLHELKNAMDSSGVYEWSEVEEFTTQYLNKVDAQELSPILGIPATRFNHELELEDEEKADFKIKAKQFVKIYGQVSSIMRYEVLQWEYLFWFLKFLIPHLIVKMKEDELIDDLLDSVDLSTYGLERTKLNHSIELDASHSEVDPQNPNPRGVKGGEEERDPLDDIIQTFNERWFSGLDETAEEGRIRVMSYARNLSQHKDFESKVNNNSDEQNSQIALEKIMDEILLAKRKANVDEYKKWVTDDAYRANLLNIMRQMINRGIPPNR